MPTKPGYRVFIDISSFKQVSRGGNKHWLVIVDEFSDYAHSFFLKKKSDQIKILPIWIKGIAKKHRIEIKRIRLDNSGENKSLQKECDKQNDRIPSTTPGAEPPRDAKDSGSARSHSTHLETSSSDRP